MKRKYIPGECSTMTKQIYEGSTDTTVYIEDKIRLLLRLEAKFNVKCITSLWGWIDVICKALYPKHKFMGKKQQLIEIMSSFHFAFISCNCVNSSHQLDRISKPKNQNQSNHSNQSEQNTTSRGGQSEFEVNKQVNWLRRGKKQASKWWLVLVRIWLVKKVVWVFWTNHLEK